MADGQRYGPITRDELDQWATEQRVNGECQVWQVGWPQWRLASEIYPGLATPPAPVPSPAPNPLSASPSSPQQPKQGVVSQLVQFGIKEMTDPERVKARAEANKRHQEQARKTQAEIGKHLKKLVRNPVAWVAVVGFSLLFFGLFLVAILTIDLDSLDTGRSTENASKRGGGGLYHKYGKLSSFATQPPPVKEAVAQGKEVWCLIGYESSGGDTSHLYVVIDDDGELECVVLKSELEITEALAEIAKTDKKPGEFEHSWGLTYANKPTNFEGGESLIMTTTWNGRTLDLYSEAWATRGDKLKLEWETTITILTPSPDLRIGSKETGHITATANGWSEERENVSESSGKIDSAFSAATVQRDPHARASEDGKTWSSREVKHERYSGPVHRLHSGKARVASAPRAKHPESTARSSKAETAKQHLFDTAAKMEGPFVAVVRDIVVSVEEGVPWSIADSRMRNPGNFSFTPETMKAYREWREAALKSK